MSRQAVDEGIRGQHQTRAVEDAAAQRRFFSRSDKLAFGHRTKIPASPDLPLGEPHEDSHRDDHEDHQQDDQTDPAVGPTEHRQLPRGHLYGAAQAIQSVLLGPIHYLRLRAPAGDDAFLGLDLPHELRALLERSVYAVPDGSGLKCICQLDESEEKDGGDDGEESGGGTDTGLRSSRDPPPATLDG